MSDFAAVAALTETLRFLLLKAAERYQIPGIEVTIGRPKDEKGSDQNRPRINIYLYQVKPDPSFRNANTPTRDSSGMLYQKPQAPLDLHYLISFYGEEPNPQLLLGLTAVTLKAIPFLTPAIIDRAMGALPPGTPPEVAQSGLSNQSVEIRLSPIRLSLDEMSKFWTSFFQVPYTLSMAYEASVVLLDADLTPATPLPVKPSGASHPTSPARLPQITGLVSADPYYEPSKPFEIHGINLPVRQGVVQVGNTDPVSVNSRPGGRLMIAPLPALAGSFAVRVGQRVELGSGPRTLLQAEAPESLVVKPVITPKSLRVKPGKPPTLTLKLQPAVAEGQDLSLLLNEYAPAPGPQPRAYRFEAVQSGSQLSFELPGVAAGNYLVQVQVDGQASRLDTDESGTYSQPRFALKPGAIRG